MSTREEQGEAPPPSVEHVERTLDAKRRELQDAERQREAAEVTLDVDAVVAATQRAGVLRKFIARLEEQLSEAREAQCRKDADARLLGIRRAYGSVATSIDGDEKRVREKVAELTDSVRRLNERYTHAMTLSAEAAALCDRFGLAMPALPPIVAPAQRDLDCTPEVGLLRSAQHRPVVEHCEHGVRERRTYEEVCGTEGYRIIEAAGRAPWPALTEQQQRFVAERAREQVETQRQFRGMGQTIEAVMCALDAVPGISG